MSLSYIGSTTLYNTSAVRDGVTNSTTDTCVIVDGNFIRTVNLTSLVQTASAGSLGFNPVGVSFINNASAVFVGNSNSVWLYEQATGYKQAYVGDGNTFVIGSRGGTGCIVAGDPSSNIAIGLDSASNSLNKFDGNTFTLSHITVLGFPTAFFLAVTLKSPGRWLIADNSLCIYEINSSGDIIDQFSWSQDNFPAATAGVGQIVQQNGAVTCLTYLDNGIVFVATPTIWSLIEWNTKTVLKTHVPQFTGGSGNDNMYAISNPASGIVLVRPTTYTSSGNAMPQSAVMELDLTVQPFTIRDQVYLDTGTAGEACGINTSTGVGWTVDNANPAKLHTFQVTPRDTVMRTFFVQTSSGGTDQAARLLLIDDTTTPCKILLDTYMKSPAQYRVPTGKTIMECVKIGQGATATWDISRYST